MKPTQYDDINHVINAISQGTVEIFQDQLIGIYLFGSLTYDDFNSERSDIDLVTILKEPASATRLKLVQILHQQVEKDYPKWAKRIENSFTPQYMLSSILPPKEPRPYYGEGRLYPEADYGNEWIINLYLLYQHGIALIGPKFSELVNPIDVREVQEASARDLFKEWEPKLRGTDWLDNSHYQSYLILNLCRILCTVMTASVVSKKASATWVKSQFPQWANLIQTAENWSYDREMGQKELALDFLRFTITKVNSTNLSHA